MLRYIFCILFLFCLLATPAQAFTPYAEKMGPAYAAEEDGLQAIKITTEGFLSDKTFYALADKHGNIAALTPAISKTAHKLDCGRPQRCVVYDVWHWSPANTAIWDMGAGVAQQARIPLIPTSNEADQKDWLAFINSRTGGRYETLHLNDLQGKTLGTANIYGKKENGNDTLASLMALYFFGVFLILAFYVAKRAMKKYGVGYLIIGLLGYGTAFLSLLIISAPAFTIPLPHYAVFLLLTATALCYAYKRACRPIARQNATT